jgi:TetR/AcrR family transcriptional regulator, lmrAB and yxaGH operons repressor
MARGVRDRMIGGAADLLSRRGLRGTSFSEVLDATGAPRGSIYHHFPGGKEELVGETVRMIGDRLLRALARLEGEPADEVVTAFVAMWRRVLTGSDLQSGCSVAAVVVDAGEEFSNVVAIASGVFAGWTSALESLLVHGGVPAERASSLAVTVLAGVEGAMILARAAGDFAPFDAVGAELVELTRGVSRRRGR